jgi:predicted Zn-dependent protease
MQLTTAQGTPAEAARAFFATEGISGSPTTAAINGLPAAGGAFSVQTEQGVLQGEVQFIQHRQLTFQFLGFAPTARWSAYQGAVRSALRSFRPLTDQRLLAVQPWRMDIVRVDRSQTPAEFVVRYPGPVSADDIALLNQVDAGGRFMNRNLVKRIVGQPLPR